MSGQLRWDNKVVIITGAGNGLGKEYALFFASRGAKVVVNDLGGSAGGQGADNRAAQVVVDEIKKAGGQAVANFDSVEFGDKIVKTAMDTFGRVDAIINNAGILRDISFQKMTDLDWDLIMKVHLKGTFSVTRAAWNIFREQGFGRIVNTASGSGIYGSFGQANYATAKLGIHGFTQSLAKEGEKRNIFVNTIAPVAASRMTETVMSKEALANLSPKYIVPLVAFLAHEDCEETGSLFEVAGGYVGKFRWARGEGHSFDYDNFTVEEVKKNWEKVCDFTNMEFPEGQGDTFGKISDNVERNAELQAKKVKKNNTAGTIPVYEQIFTMMKNYIAEGDNGKTLVKKVAATFGFDVLDKKGGKVIASFSINLKEGNGSVAFEKPKKADTTFTMVGADLELLIQGKLNPQNAFMQGKMKIKGNMAKAMKFTPELFPPATPENIAKYSGKAKL